MKRFWIIKQFRSFGYSIRNLIRWLPIIWKDRDWDQFYLENILIFKLKNMSKFYHQGKNVYSVESDKVAAEIDEVVNLFERIQKDEYELEIDPNFNDWITDDRPLSTKEMIDRELCRIFNGPDFSEEELEYRKQVYENALTKRQKDLQTAYRLISENIDGWWD